MAKHNKRRHLETKRRKFEAKSETKSATNLFEFHRNRVKHDVVGRKVAKSEVSNKAVARNRSYVKRKNTILEEYKHKHKSGKGVQDLRHNHNNEDNHQLTQQLDISLNEKTFLTHKGKQLTDFLDDRVGSDDEDVDLFSRPEFVESTHFGGGSDGRPKSANEVLNQIMDEKRDKQLERQANIDLTQKLDTDWSAVKSILRHKSVNHVLPKTGHEDFDVLVKELMFDSNKPVTRGPITVSQTNDKPTDSKSETTPIVLKSVHTLFKELIEQIEVQTDWTQVLSLINSGNHLLTQITDESIDLNLLIEKYQIIIQTQSDFNCRNLAFIWFGCHFKQTKPFVRLVLIQMLSKLKYNSFNEIAIVLVINKLLLMTANGSYIPELFDSIIKVLYLCQQNETIEVKIGHKNRHNCILAINQTMTCEKSPVFNITYIFDDTFSCLPEMDIKSMLLTQTFERIQEMVDLYSTLPSFNELIAPLKTLCSQLSLNDCFNDEMKCLLSEVMSKLNREAPKVVLNERRRKPFMLAMFEPKFDDNPNTHKKNDKKKLTKKYNRELKGAQRELRKDSAFIRNTWIEEKISNDQNRKKKVKLLMSDLAQQQGLYKKHKK